MKLLDQANIASDETELMNHDLYTFKQSRELEQGLVNWKAKSKADKTWPNVSDHFTVEYFDRRKHTIIEAKQGFRNASNITEQEQEQSDAYQMAAFTIEFVEQSKLDTVLIKVF